MKKNNLTIVNKGYATPCMDVIDVTVEQGFAGSNENVGGTEDEEA